MKSKIAFVAALLVFLSACCLGQEAMTVSGTLSDKGKPFPGGLVVLQRLKNEKCARIFRSHHVTADEAREFQSCSKDLPWINTDEKGAYSYGKLKPGWYAIRFLWLMSEPPASKSAMCATEDWALAYEPRKDKSGKYNGFAQGMPFELKANESKQVDFNYQDQFRSRDCSRGGY